MPFAPYGEVKESSLNTSIDESGNKFINQY